jgi:hypothetical protein
VGQREAAAWIEGFSLAPHDGIEPSDVKYQAVLGRGWLSPWGQMRQSWHGAAAARPEGTAQGDAAKT